MKTGDGVYGVSYRWNDAGTEAYLVEDAGVSFDLSIDDGGLPHTQTWQIPSRSDCLTCHGDRPLSFHTRQVNRVGTMNGFTGNQIEMLDAGGYLNNTPDPVSTLPAHVRPDETEYPLEQRVRSYLAVNCGYCHQAGGSVSGFWDGREILTLEQTGMIHGYPFQNGGDPANEYIVPGDPLHSIILQRAGATNGWSRMPPLATSEIDSEGIDLLTQWITSLPADRLYDDWAAIHSVLGGRSGDDDGDGRSNGNEFLLGTDPHSGNDAPPMTIAGGNLEFFRQPYRTYNILKSTDLSSWARWNVPENVTGYQETGLMESIPIETSDPASFFRLEIREP